MRRQNRRKAFGLALLGVCLVLGTTMALTGHGDGWSGFACGLWATVLLVGSYAWRVSRGAWRPAAQTTSAYLLLVRDRAVAEEKTLRFAFGVLLVAFVAYAGYQALSPGHIRGRGLLVLALLGLEVPLFVWLRRRSRRSREAAERLVAQAALDVEDPLTQGDDIP